MFQKWEPPVWWQYFTGEEGLAFNFLNLTLNPKPVLLAVITILLLTITAPMIWIANKKELRDKWLTWLFIALVVGPAIWVGETLTTLLAVVISLTVVTEYCKLLDLRRIDGWALKAFSFLMPFAALLFPKTLSLLPLVLLLLALVPLTDSDTSRGGLRAGYLAFGVIWLTWAPAHLVIVYSEAFLIALAVAVTDVFSWVGGKSLGRVRFLEYKFSKLSPNKTVAGLLGGCLGSFGILHLTNSFSIGMFFAIAVGAPLGDLIESMFKRQAGKKDAGNILPGFGGVLDRVDSLLLVLPLAAVLG